MNVIWNVFLCEEGLSKFEEIMGELLLYRGEKYAIILTISDDIALKIQR